ncbi:hypothetical protein [Amycolatopsis saalfeldensis]|uniref:hypothetical protein n=1 Tax=Amycolatopsis saalfeldensis TaxID=394193 RepID=UPI003CCBB7B2
MFRTVLTLSGTGVWRILHRLDMGRLPSSQRYKRHDCRWKRYEKQRPGHQVQVDAKFVEPLPTAAATGVPITTGGGRGKFYQYTAIQRSTGTCSTRASSTATSSPAHHG